MFTQGKRYALAFLALALLACVQPVLAQTAAPFDITVQQGATWSVQLQFKSFTGAPVDLTDYTASAQIRPSYAADAALLAAFTCVVTDPTHGIVTVTLTSAQTAALAAPASAVWDLFLTNTTSGTALRVLAGKVQIVARVTRP
jgi:hypothetical protein